VVASRVLEAAKNTKKHRPRKVLVMYMLHSYGWTVGARNWRIIFLNG
jgi:hypothetical protein